MIILSDTRQKKNHHRQKEAYFKSKGYIVESTKLYVGDYTLPADQSICVDTKKDIQELIMCLTKDHGRFVKEAERARSAGIKLFILVENAAGPIRGTKAYNSVIRDITELHKWINPRLFIRAGGRQKYPRATKGITLQKMVMSFREHHGCEFVFCSPDEAGEKVLEILTSGKEV